MQAPHKSDLECSPAAMPWLPLLSRAFLILFAATAICLGIEAARFHRIQAGSYRTPWYDARWWRNPYIALRVAMSDSTTETWRKNVTGEHWLVRETVIEDKTWWTRVEERGTAERP